MHIVGHQQQRELLEQSSASAVLLQGPSGVGKWLIALDHADRQGGAVAVLRDGPTVEDARQVVELYEQRQLGVSSAVTLVDLDECSAAVQNTLLKTVEEMPEWGQIVFVTSGRTLPTIQSRCFLIHFFSLHDEEVATILERDGIPSEEAKLLASLSGGSPGRGAEYREAVRSKPVVLSYLDALIRHDNTAMSTMLPRLDDNVATLLWRWAHEVLMDWHLVFTKEELSLVHKLGVRKFYLLVDCLVAGDSMDLAARKVWNAR